MIISLLRTRHWLAMVVSAAFLSQAAAPQSPIPAPNESARQDLAKTRRPAARPKVGMELWTYRRQLKADLPGTLATIRSLGFTDVETASFYGRSAPEFGRLLGAAGLTCNSIITDYSRLKNDLSTVIADAKAVGARYVLTAGFPHKDRLTAEDVHRAAADFNGWGEKLKAAGLRFGYHPTASSLCHPAPETYSI